MAAAERASPVVSMPAVRSQDSVAVHIRQVAQEHDDVGSEGYWQEMAKMVRDKWEILCRDQGPAATMSMMAKCGEMVLRIRRTQQQSQTQNGADALAEFREFMGEVTGQGGG